MRNGPSKICRIKRSIKELRLRYKHRGFRHLPTPALDVMSLASNQSLVSTIC